MSWGTTWAEDTKADAQLPLETEDEIQVVLKLKRRYNNCLEWESQARVRFDYDYKFANGDSHNQYQWDNDLVTSRELEDRPVLTVNKTQQHNLMVINDAKQNKPGIRIRPVSDEASFDAAEIFQELIYHTEYISNAETVYDSATTFQVEAGIGYWRIITDWVDDNSFDQEAYIRHIKDPRSVLLDRDINEVDGSDARYGIIFEDMANDLFKEKYPKFASLAGVQTLGNNEWLNKDTIRIAEYFYKEEKEDKLVTWLNQSEGTQVLKKLSKLSDQEKLLYKELKKQKEAQAQWQFRERKIVTDDITWCKIAGTRIIESNPWLGKYIPIVRLVGTETVIDGILDRKGHTRALINAQQIYNYCTSANVEYGALQSKAPWLAPSAAIMNFEEYYKPLALNTPLPTPNGWTTMGKVNIGDWLFDENGKPVQVKGMSAIHLGRKCYRVEFDDGSHIIADEDHLWTIERRFRKYALNAKDWVIKTLPTKLLEVEKDHIWCSKPFDLEKKELLIDPYILGVWLGDGSTASNRIHCDKKDADELINNMSNRGYEIGNAREQNSCVDITIHGMRSHLTNLGLLGNKHIPEIYLRGSHEQRLELLQGLMDSDGHYHPATKRCIFVNTDKNLIDGIFELLRTLGIKSIERQFESKAVYANGESYIGKDHYNISFSTYLSVFKFNRKSCLQSKRTKFNWRRIKRFRITKIEEVSSVPVRCVAIDSPSHLFLAGKGMIPTHNTANTQNHSYLPYNHIDADGEPIPAPSRPQPPQPGPAYTEGLRIAQDEMMMASGQYQSQFGENENAKSGVAINARQRQGDRSTYHFIDNQAIAIRYTGKILIDLYPKIYDTKRIKQILTRDGTKMNIHIDPNAPQASQEMPTLNTDQDRSKRVEQVLFNPNVGTYDIRADTGPSFATKRIEAFNAMSQLATSPNSKLMDIAGDLYFKTADFPEADILAERYRRTIPPNILGDTPDPQTEQILHQASDKIQQLTAMIGDMTKKLADKDKELDIKASEVKIRSDEMELRNKEAIATQHRLDYEAETKRVVALGNSGPAISVDQIQPVVAQLMRGMLNANEPGSGDRIAEHSLDKLASEQAALNGSEGGVAGSENPPVPGARKAADGNHYVHINGKYHKVEMAA